MKRFDRASIIALLTTLISFSSSQAIWALTETAQKIFEKNNESVYQIRIIDLNSGEKSSIGSGFRFSKEGLFATNYHVISEVISTPERYRIEYRKNNGERGDLFIKAIDVTYDLAILKSEEMENKSYLPLVVSPNSKGDKVFPMGNPLDLGMTIIEGTYNGAVGKDPYRQILLSAPLNEGMSGGPAIDSMGKIVGINVAMQGNDLSYLVPVQNLIDLVNRIKEENEKHNWKELVQEQILKKHDWIIRNVLETKWEYEIFGELKVPQNILPAILKCWGVSQKEQPEQDHFFSFSHKYCETEESVYLVPDLLTGTIGYSFIWINSENLNSLKIYKKLSKVYANSNYYPEAEEEDVTEFDCHNDFVKVADHDWKAVYCVRHYKNFKQLNDVVLNLVALGNPNRGEIIRIGLAGINEILAKKFLQEFLRGIKWVD